VSEMSWTAVRRCHLYAPRGKSTPLRCPDCGAYLLEIVDFACGAIRKTCKRCKDVNRDSVQWIFVLHKDVQDYMMAVKRETSSVEPELPLDK
jgi:phage FluMu protein Com